MGKITTFTLSEFLVKTDTYHDMLDVIETRAAEIAREFGKIDEHWHTISAELYAGTGKIYCCAKFAKNHDINIEKAFQFDADWLFSDVYKDRLKDVETQKQIERDKEYLEYLRLKQKFEGTQGECPLKNMGN